LLFRAIVYQPSSPILIADDDRLYKDASSGAAKLLGRSREEIIGQSVDDFTTPEIQKIIPQEWGDY
jgi:PAS domain S-box-containing protein